MNLILFLLKTADNEKLTALITSKLIENKIILIKLFGIISFFYILFKRKIDTSKNKIKN